MSIGQSVITTCRINIRIHRDIEGNMWFGVGRVGLLKNHLLNLRLVDTPASPTKPMPRRDMVAGSGHVGNITVANCHPIPFLIAGVTPKLRTEVEVEGKIPSGKLGNLSTRPVDEHCRWKI